MTQMSRREKRFSSPPREVPFKAPLFLFNELFSREQEVLSTRFLEKEGKARVKWQEQFVPEF